MKTCADFNVYALIIKTITITIFFAVVVFFCCSKITGKDNHVKWKKKCIKVMQLFNKLNYIMSIKFMFVAVFCVIKNKKIVFFFDRLFYVAEFLSVRNNSTVLLPFCEVRENNWNKMFCCFTVSIRKCGKKELSIDLSVCISYLIVDISLVPIMSSNLRKILMRCWLNSSKIFSWKNSNSNFELNMFFT